jgi:hypothetical protein
VYVSNEVLKPQYLQQLSLLFQSVLLLHLN